MNRTGTVLYPEEFHGRHIRTHLDFESDLTYILERSGRKADFGGKYKQRLRFLDERHKNCIQRSDWFEKLKHANNLYAMKFNRNEKNIRILFSFISCEEIQYAVLLYAFDEKDRKNQSRFSYGSSIPIAQERLKEVLE